MAETNLVKEKSNHSSPSDASVEAAVRRLIEAGMTRRVALSAIDQALYKAIGQLNAVGIGGLSRLRQLNLSAGMKLNALRVEEANEEDARDGR